MSEHELPVEDTDVWLKVEVPDVVRALVWIKDDFKAIKLECHNLTVIRPLPENPVETALKARVAQLEAVLRWYADISNYQWPKVDGEFDWDRRARAALEAKEEE